MTPTTVMSAPASAGPTIMLMLMPTESSATALVTPELPRRSWISERLDGMSSAQPIPATRITAYACQKRSEPVHSNPAITTAPVKVRAWTPISRRRRSITSASMPPTRPSRSIGVIANTPTRATRSAESVSSRTSQPSSVNCIQRDEYARMFAGQSRR